MEFAFALVLLSMFFALYMQCIQLIIEHERLTFAAFVAARTYDVQGEKAALNAGYAVDDHAIIHVDTWASQVDAGKQVRIPEGLRPVFSNGYPWVNVRHTAPIFDEQYLQAILKGDN